MNYEEKYNEALKAMKDLYNKMKYLSSTDALLTSQTIEKAFPELRESEDERIRKELIERFNWELKSAEEQDAAGCSRQKDIAMFKRGLAWLEKQGEQKFIEQDTEVNDLWVYIREWNDKFGRLPKDEDELAACIDYVMKRQKAAWSEKHIADVFEKVGLARIVREQGNDQLTNAVQSAMIELSKQQNTAWSEEDESMFLMCSDAIAAACAAAYYTTEEMNKMQNWLKSLKPNHWKPSDLQLEALESAYKQLPNIQYFLQSLYNDLLKL